MPLDFTFRIHLVTLPAKLLMMLLGLIDVKKNNDVII